MKSTSCFARAALALALGLMTGVPGLAGAAAPAGEQGQPAGVYQQTVPEMTTLECARCHYQVFVTIRDRGGRHQLECRECHLRFHSFKPGLAWEERVPSCRQCHDPVHGAAFVKCLACHREAHAPLESMVGAEQLAGTCADCHRSAATELEEHPSAHAEMGCAECHQGRHGYRPKCSGCHSETHTPVVDNAGCQVCHPSHRPLEVTLKGDIDNQLCRGCHPQPAAAMAESQKKHSAMACVFCHAGTHGFSPTCQQCHGDGPHNPELLKGFEDCRDCHGEPHGLSLTPT